MALFFLYPGVYQLRQKQALFSFGLSFVSGETERMYVDELSVSLSRERLSGSVCLAAW